MKKYNSAFIKQYIKSHQDSIESVFCGMKEDWNWIAEVIWDNGTFRPRSDCKDRTIQIAGITGSTWATPVMQVNFKDGHTEITSCFYDDGKIALSEQIAEQKAFAMETGGSPLA